MTSGDSVHNNGYKIEYSSECSVVTEKQEKEKLTSQIPVHEIPSPPKDSILVVDDHNEDGNHNL